MQFHAVTVSDEAITFFTVSAETESLNKVAAHVLQPCEGTQGNMATITLNTNEDIHMVTTPLGFSCATNQCDKPDVNIGPCELDYLITVRVINCNSDFSGKHASRQNSDLKVIIWSIICYSYNIHVIVLFLCIYIYIVSVTPIEPHNGNAVCPFGTVKYFCTANYDEIGWIFNGTRIVLYTPTATYSDSTSILETTLGDSTESDAGKHITSTATIKNVQIEYDGLLIECYDIGGKAHQVIQVEGIIHS